MTDPKPTPEDRSRAYDAIFGAADRDQAVERVALEFARVRAEEREACLSDCRAVALAFYVEAERRHEASQIRANLERQEIGAEACAEKIRVRGES